MQTKQTELHNHLLKPCCGSKLQLPGSSRSDPLEDNVESPQCNVGDQGFYGEEAVNETPIEFKYELEYEPQSSIDEVVAALERAVLDKVLPTLFGGECGMRHQLRKRLQAVGASTKPPDIEIFGRELYLTKHIA
jgi:hypothetical protein